MKLHILIDNIPAADLACEHGLSMLLQTSNGDNYLIDTGASGAFIANMEKLGLCNIDEIKGAFISHGHNDHTGGMRKFLENNSTAPVYLHNAIQGNWFFSCRPKNNVREARSIGMEQALFAEYHDRFNLISTPTAINDFITLIPVGEESGNLSNNLPQGNKFLFMNDFPDKFIHEIAIVIEFAPEQFAIVSPCSHNGILNILKKCSEYIMEKLSGREIRNSVFKYFIGGLHYVDYLPAEEATKEAAQISWTAEKISADYPCLKVMSGHCTCSNAAQILKGVLNDRYSHFCCGTTVALE